MLYLATVLWGGSRLPIASPVQQRPHSLQAAQEDPSEDLDGSRGSEEPCILSNPPMSDAEGALLLLITSKQLHKQLDVMVSHQQGTCYWLITYQVTLPALSQSTAAKYCRKVLSHSTVAKYCCKVLSQRTVAKYCRTVLSQSTVAKYCRKVPVKHNLGVRFANCVALHGRPVVSTPLEMPAARQPSGGPRHAALGAMQLHPCTSICDG